MVYNFEIIKIFEPEIIAIIQTRTFVSHTLYIATDMSTCRTYIIHTPSAVYIYTQYTHEPVSYLHVLQYKSVLCICV